MKKSDFIENWTDARNDALDSARRALEKCELYGVSPMTVHVDISTGHYVEIEYPQATASQLECILCDIADQMERLEAFYNAIYSLATAQNELESVDWYEFEDEAV
jgi:flavin-binding protein dodecin